MNLKVRFENLASLYRKRNAIRLQGLQLLLFVNEAIRQLSKLIRKGETDSAVLAQALASVFARVSSYADSFVDLPIVLALSEKFPIGFCAYCGKLPCACELNRKTEIAYQSGSPHQFAWDVKEWCAHMEELYGQVNRGRGMNIAMARLVEEMQEVGAEQFSGGQKEEMSFHELEEIRTSIAREFADVFAWIFAIAGILEIDLQMTLDQMYGPDSKQWEKHSSHYAGSIVH